MIDTSSVHPPRIAVLFVLATVPLLFGAVHPIVQSGYVCLVLAGLGGWLLLRRTEERPIAWRWLLPMLILLGWAALQSLPLPISLVELLSPARAERMRQVALLAGDARSLIPLSDQGAASLHQVILYLALLVYFLALRTLLDEHPTFLAAVAGVIALVGAGEALYGLFQFLRPQLGVLWLSISQRAAQGTIIYKNQYAALLNLCWPVAVGLAVAALGRIFAVDPRRSSRRFGQMLRNLNRENRLVGLYLLAAGMMLLAVLFSLSRGGIISMLVVLFTLNLTLPLARRTRLTVAAVLLFFLGGYGLLLGLDTVVNRFNSIDQSGLGRLNVYLASLPMVHEHWLTGIGLGSYDLLSPVYLKGLPAQVHFDHAHNEYLEFAVELGLPAAALLFGWLATLMVRAGLGLSRLHRTEEARSTAVLVGTAAFAALVGLFVHGWVDFGWRLPATLFYATTLAALVATALRPRPGRSATHTRGEATP